ncbi:hypothetical protein DFQ26_009081 [Actinomortierella ambigua]|nr:hypothetical protein DFQ26_009081 [Actinomortierella ambigua]
MTVEAPAVRTERIDLGDGLIMRWSTAADKDDIGELMAEGFRYRALNRTIPKGYKPLRHDFIRAATRRVMSGHSAVMDPTDFAVVEDTNAKTGELRLVAGIGLQRLPGYYGKTDLQYGIGELVASLPKYRNRGLVRRLFTDMIHPASEARGDIIQLVFGIPHFYLQFGYIQAIRTREYVLFNNYDFIPKLAEGKKEPFTLRTPTRADLPFLLKMSTREAQNCPADIGFHYDETYWLYTAFETIEKAESYHDGDRISRIVVDRKSGEDVGLVIFSASAGLFWHLFTLNESPERGITYRETMFPILRQVLDQAREQWNGPLDKLRLELKAELEADEQRRQASDDPEVKFAPVIHPLLEYGTDRASRLAFFLHPSHPVRQICKANQYSTQVFPGYRGYVRINSYPRFLTKVASTLEDRLAKSPMAGLSATLHVSFYRITEGASAKGLKLCFIRGKLIAAEDWAEPSDEAQVQLDRAAVLAADKKKKAKETRRQTNGNGEIKEDGTEGEEDEEEPLQLKAYFPPLVFSRLVLGEMSFEQLKLAYEDSFAIGNDCKMLLAILFPVADHNADNFWW